MNNTILPVFALAALSSGTAGAAPQKPPNIIFILTDDLGIGDVGVFFQNARRATGNRAEPWHLWHLTPHIDAMANAGLQMPQHYCPAPVCAPSRASLLLGVHQGHANVRDNQFDKALENNHTLASVLKQGGYATAAIGKWGLQGKPATAPPDWPAHPLDRGFDYYYGYIRHADGHEHYPKEGIHRGPKEVWDNRTEVSAQLDKCYTTDLFTARAKKWISDQRTTHPRQPFFLYLAYDTPHAVLQLPTQAYLSGGGRAGGLQWVGQPGHMINTATGTPDSYNHPDYATATWDNDRNAATPEKPWPDVYKRYATSVRRIDDGIGDILQLLKDLQVDDDTLVVFSSDNGPSRESYLQEAYEPTFFNSFGPHDGIKRDLWEGGIRVGAIARWPGQIQPGRVSPTPSGFWDWMPTLCELAGLPAPARSDGVSLVPTLRGVGTQKPSRVYIEYFEGAKTPAYEEFLPSHRGRVRRQMQALRIGDFMGVRYNIASHADPFEIYNVATDPQQKNNLASDSAWAALQQQMHDTVLRVRRPDAGAPRPYDDELMPAVNVGNTIGGVTWRAVNQALPWVANLDDVQPSATGICARPDLTVLPRRNDVGIEFSGYIQVPADGAYTFHLATDSGALLRIHEATVIDADGGYRAGSEAIGSIRLQAGHHPIRLFYARRQAGTPSLSLQWSSATLPREDIAATAFSHDGVDEE